MQLQVDLQIAEYELNKAKEKLKTNKLKGGYDDEEESTNSSSDQTGDKSSIKRKKSQGAFSRAENYNEKKARFETTIESFNNYLKDPKEKENNRKKDDPKKSSGSSENGEIEELIKNGEMTPFGTLIDFEKGRTLENNKKESASKTKPKNSNHSDFDSFFLDLDKQIIKSAKNKPKPSITKQDASLKLDKNQTSDMLNKEKDSEKNAAQKLPNVSLELKKDLNKKSFSSTYVESSLSEFDKFLIDLDRPKTSKQAEKETKNKSNLLKEIKTRNGSKVSNQDLKLIEIPKASNKNKETTKSKKIFTNYLEFLVCYHSKDF